MTWKKLINHSICAVTAKVFWRLAAVMPININLLVEFAETSKNSNCQYSMVINIFAIVNHDIAGSSKEKEHADIKLLSTVKFPIYRPCRVKRREFRHQDISRSVFPVLMSRKCGKRSVITRKIRVWRNKMKFYTKHILHI